MCYLVTKQCVAGLASLRPVKFRLYDVTMVFFSPFFTSLRSHCPMHGPHALAKTFVVIEIQEIFQLFALKSNYKITYSSSKFSECFGNTVTFDGSTDLLGSGSDIEWNFRFQAMFHGILGDGSTTTHILIRRVGA